MTGDPIVRAVKDEGLPRRDPARGYLLVAAGAAMFALGGNLARYLLDDGVNALRLSQLRSAGSVLLLGVVLAVRRPDLLRVRRRDVPSLAFLGICGLALVHATYYEAIDRLEIGVALTIQYMAPLVLLVWLRVFHGRRVANSLWGAVALSIAGCFFVVRAYDPGSLDGLGVLAAFGAMVTFAIYMVGSERAGHDYEPVTTLFWAFGFATLFWTILEPWWTFPFGAFDNLRNLLLAVGVVLVGTLLPFICVVAALRHLPAPRVAVAATLEPVLAALFAWWLHDERLAAVQLAGGALVLGAVLWVQSRRPDLEAELAPPLREAR
jgi:drug/metabolite transporter (DMT)-like permease